MVLETSLSEEDKTTEIALVADDKSKKIWQSESKGDPT